MCFKKPKIPTVVADPELAAQKEEVKADAQETRAADKETRLNAALSRANGTFGRSSLFTGGAGGAGYAAPAVRSLFEAG